MKLKLSPIGSHNPEQYLELLTFQTLARLAEFVDVVGGRILEVFDEISQNICISNWKVSWILLHFFFLLLSLFSVPTEEWCLDKEIGSGHLYLRRDSSKVKFRCDVEVLEFVRDPEEELLCRTEYYPYRDCESRSHPMVVISTCIAAIAVTVILPWLMISVNEPIE